MKLILCFVLCIFFSLTTSAQSNRLYVYSPDSLPLYSASVQLYVDGNFVTGGYTDTLGTYTFDLGREGKVAAKVTNLGFSDLDTTLRLVPDQEYRLYFPRTGSWLDEIVVKDTRAYVERVGTDVNLQIKGSKRFGTNALRILEGAPGVQVVNGDVKLLGENTRIYLNGKISRYSAAQLTNLLENKDAVNIERIELIRNPGAEYAANEGGSVINVVYRKREGDGYLLNLNGRVPQSSEHTSVSGSANLYVRKGRLGVNLYADDYLNQQLERGESDRNLSAQRGDIVRITERSRAFNRSWGPSYGADLDYTLSPTSELNASFSGYDSRSNNRTEAKSMVTYAMGPDTLVELDGSGAGHSSNTNYNLHFSTRTDTLGSQLDLDIEYDRFNQTFKDGQGLNYQARTGGDPATSNRDQFVTSRQQLLGFRADYQWVLAGGSKLKTGLQLTDAAIEQENTQSFSDRFGSGLPQTTENLTYRERIAAAYASLSTSFLGLNVDAGLRGEYTHYAGASASRQSVVASNYFNLFPKLSVSKRLPNHFFSLSASRRISRPRFNQLIPFRRFLSAYYYYTGNPNLIAYFPYSVGAYYSFKSKIYARVSYSRSNNRILEYSIPDPENPDLTVGVKRNNSFSSTTGLVLGYNNRRLTEKLAVSANVRYSIGTQAVELGGETTEVFAYDSYNIYLSPRYTFSKRISAGLNFYYSSDVYYSVQQNLSYYYLGGNLDISVLKDRGTLSFSGRDLLLTGITRSVARYGNIDYRSSNNWDSRIVQFAFSYAISSEGVKNDRRRRETANSEVKRRAIR